MGMEALYVVAATLTVVWGSALLGAFIYWRGTSRGCPVPNPSLRIPGFLLSPVKRAERIVEKRASLQSELMTLVKQVGAGKPLNGRL
jgi:hypothetical protein